MSAPSVYAAIHAVAADLAEHGIAKSRCNTVGGYDYRSIDDVLVRLAPLLAKHRLCILPRVMERSVSERMGEGGHLLIHVALRARFTLISVDDGTGHDVEAYGEALDGGDKATPKAMSAAYKIAMLQTFCVPVAGLADVDATSQKLARSSHEAEPIQGWKRWCEDIIDVAALCESEKALALVQERNRPSLIAVSREQPELYARVGEAFANRRAVFAARPTSTNLKQTASAGRTKRKRSQAAAVEHV